MELSEPAVRVLVERYARLVARVGDEIGERRLVLPTGEDFPDRFRGDEKSVRRLVRRMRAHAALDDVPMSVHVIGADEDGSCGTGSCGTGSCATPAAPEADAPRLIDEGDGWKLNVPAAEVAFPVVLTTNLARALATIFLVETRSDEASIEQPIDVSVDIAAVALGFGVLMLDGSYIYAKSCGGPRVSRATRLGPSELGVLTALFAALGGHSTRAAIKHLEATQKAALSAASEWFDSNPELIERLRKDPARIAAGEYELSDPKPWLMRLFGKKKRAADPLEAALSGDASADELDSLLATMPLPSGRRESKPRDPKLDELRRLVDEALEEPQGAAQ
jgi:hypothetical protein